MSETKLNYKNDKGINIIVEMEEDINLTKAFAYFIDFTRMIGYHPHSWVNILDEINADGGLSNDYTAYDWAADILYG